ncbi:acetoin reductase family protein [Hysterangium stoloniferum]|nr:acetoin reductase family protein [Hysterangium stoloniferum]
MSNPANTTRVVIVTGAAGDLGSAIAQRLAGEGYKLSLSDLPSRKTELQAVADAITSAGGTSFIVTGDVTKEEQVQHIVAETVKHFKRLDVMVSNVGKFVGAPVQAFDVNVWDDVMNVNVKSMMLCYKTAANQMVKQQETDKANNIKANYRIIGGCSVAGLTGAPLCGAYAASKFAVRGLTQVTAAELGPLGITVNSYAPGFVGGTKMVDTLDDTITNTFQIPQGAWRVAAVDSIKLKRMGETKNIAAIVSYLASPDADWTTGQTIAVDGGMHLA